MLKNKGVKFPRNTIVGGDFMLHMRKGVNIAAKVTIVIAENNKK